MSKKYETIKIRLSDAQLEICRVRAVTLGLTLEEFIVYVLIRYMDDKRDSSSSS